MSREKSIKKSLAKGVKVELDDVLEGDILSLNQIKSNTERKIFENKRLIKSLLKNHQINLGEEIINANIEEKRLREKIETIDSILNNYLNV